MSTWENKKTPQITRALPRSNTAVNDPQEASKCAGVHAASLTPPLKTVVYSKKQNSTMHVVCVCVCVCVFTHLQLKRLDLRDASERRRKGDLGGLLASGHDVNDPRHHGLSELDLLGGQGGKGELGVFLNEKEKVCAKTSERAKICSREIRC